MFLYGKNSVVERLKSNPKSIQKIFLADNFSEACIEKKIQSLKIPVKRVSQKELHRIKCADSLQGIVAKICDFKYADLENLVDTSEDKKLSFIFLDRVFDPQNLGAILRITACFGRFAIVIPRRKACGITDTVLHVAQGAENFTPVAMVSNLTNAILYLKKSGYWIVGAVLGDGRDINEIDFPFPLCFVLGSEGEGIRYGVDKHLDIKAHIRMEGAPLSFNVAGACAVFCHEIAKQRSK